MRAQATCRLDGPDGPIPVGVMLPASWPVDVVRQVVAIRGAVRLCECCDREIPIDDTSCPAHAERTRA